jgi:hypothetical protein
MTSAIRASLVLEYRFYGFFWLHIHLSELLSAGMPGLIERLKTSLGEIINVSASRLTGKVRQTTRMDLAESSWSIARS